jgi:2-polyprenyl-3-methyl-5-hydroxy-6-metoxy-1,4-benzoquinol methylase
VTEGLERAEPTALNETPQDRSTDLCPICGSPPANRCLLSSPDRLHGTPGTFCVAVCAACGGGWTIPPASTGELASFYPDSYQAHQLQTGILGAVQERGQRLILNRAFARPPMRALGETTPGTVLDVGCGRGDLGGALARRGWRVVGVEPSAAAAAIARVRGVDTHVGTLESVELQAESFDAVVMHHTLEHFPNTLVDLARVHRLLRPGGLVVISVPNFASWQRELFGSRWFPLDLPRHRTHFTPRSLELALAATGFELVSLQSTSETSSLVATLQYVLAGQLLLTRVPAAWASYGVQALLSPLNRVVDRVRGEAAVLDAVARRPR